MQDRRPLAFNDGFCTITKNIAQVTLTTFWTKIGSENPDRNLADTHRLSLAIATKASTDFVIWPIKRFKYPNE